MIIQLLTVLYIYMGKTIVSKNTHIKLRIVSAPVGNDLVFYLPTGSPDRSDNQDNQDNQDSQDNQDNQDNQLPRNHAPPVGGAAKQPLLQTTPDPTLEAAFRVGIGCKYKT